jgi:hypothetical protein
MPPSFFLIRAFFIVIISLVAAACTTPYQPNTVIGSGGLGGFKDRKIADNAYFVEFRGNGNTPKTTVERYFLYRCAEITKEKGYKYFSVVLNPKVGAFDELEPLAGAVERDGFLPVKSRGGGTSYYYVPGGTYTVRIFIGQGTVRMYNQNDVPGVILGWSAVDVMKSLDPFMKDVKNVVPMPPISIIDKNKGLTNLPDPLKLPPSSFEAPPLPSLPVKPLSPKPTSI